MPKQGTRFSPCPLCLTSALKCQLFGQSWGSIGCRCFSFSLSPVPPRSEWDPDVSLWSGHRVRVWISRQASLYEHQVGKECASLFHIVIARSGMTNRASGVGKEVTALSLISWMPPAVIGRAGVHSEHGETIYLYQHHSRGSKIYLWNLC